MILLNRIDLLERVISRLDPIRDKDRIEKYQKALEILNLERPVGFAPTTPGFRVRCSAC
jgi:hypothetical protein